MGHKRKPEAYLGSEDYRIVKFTHDIDLARRLMYAKLTEAYGADFGGRLGRPERVYVRCLGALPASFAASEGWSFEFHEEKPPIKSGAFKAVVFRC
jgi:hypothetical protein